MTVTKSTLNSKLPTVSKIAFCASAGKSMATSIYTGENGQFSRLVGFKQNSKTYPFQIQYRQRSRYTNTNAKVKGAQWTNWSDWKNAVAVSGIAQDATETAKPSNKWLKSNKGVNKNGTYQTFFTFTNYLIPDLYDARQFQFRIRTFNKAKAKHGNWTTQTLSIYKRAAVEDETLITGADGGLKINFNYIWDRTCSIKVNSIKDAEGRELVKKAYVASLETILLSNSTFPTARQGYQGGRVTIPISKLKRKIDVDEALTLDISFLTADNAPTPFASGTVIEPTRNIDVTITRTWEEARGLLKVQVTNNDSVTLSSIGTNISYIYNGKTYAVGAIKEELDLAATSTFYFLTPIGIPLTLNVKEEDSNDYKDVEESEEFTLNAAGYRFNCLADLTIAGVAWGNPSYDIGGEPQYETALPYGRVNNVIFYGKGTQNKLSFKATIVDKDDCYGAEYARKEMWDKIRNNQGLYYFRTNQGDMYKVGITEVNISHDAQDLFDVDVDMLEVV